jgi:hypothetical protein
MIDDTHDADDARDRRKPDDRRDPPERIADAAEELPEKLDNVKTAIYHLGARPGIGSKERSLSRTDLKNDAATPLWMAMRAHSKAIGFRQYQAFVNEVLARYVQATRNAASPLDTSDAVARRFASYVRQHGLDPYQLIKIATEAFLLRQAGVWSFDDVGGQRKKPGRASKSPRLEGLMAERSLEDAQAGELAPTADDDPFPSEFAGGVDGPATYGEARRRLRNFFRGEPANYLDKIVPSFAKDLDDQWAPFKAFNADLTVHPPLIELIWSYWHEEGMLSQTLAAIALRFQNVRGNGAADKLSELAFDAVRPLTAVLFGYINDEPHRLSVMRRAYEYNQQYGLVLVGKATRTLRPADARSQFLEAFHNLLRLAAIFHSQDDDTTVLSDGFPVLNALKEVHLILAEGAHNQFRDLPWTARVEMMVEQWIMARPEMKEFLRGRLMVPYTEDWMGGVDAMKRLQGWSDVSVTHFRDLGVHGEQLLLTIRHFPWQDILDQEVARAWARTFRPEIQGYIHAYRAVTGVDLGNPDVVDATLPALHLQRRLVEQRQLQARPGARQQFLRAPRPGTVIAADAGALISPPTPVIPVAQSVRQLPAPLAPDGRGP